MAIDTTSGIYQAIPSSDIKTNAKKIKTYPMWNDLLTDTDSYDEGVIRTFYTSSTEFNTLFDSNYYLNIYDSNKDTNPDAKVQFSISIGSKNKLELSGSNDIDRYTYPTYAIYKQFSMLFNNNNDFGLTNASGVKTVNNFYAISVSKSLLKSGINRWQLVLGDQSGSTNFVNLIDSTEKTNGTVNSGVLSVPIVLGELSNYVDVSHKANSSANAIVSASASLATNYAVGTFYPNEGIYILDADIINNFIGITTSSVDFSVSPFDSKKALSTFYNKIVDGEYFASRVFEIINSTYYFINIKHDKFNSSNNPTWNASKFDGDSGGRTYITGIGLYDTDGTLIAIAKLSKPIAKTPDSELSIQVRLDF